MQRDHGRSTHLLRSCVLAAVLLGLAVPAGAQYGGFYNEEEFPPNPSPPPSAVTPTPTAKPSGALALSVTYRKRGLSPRPFPATVPPGGMLAVEIRVMYEGTPPAVVRVAAMPLDDGVGVLMPSRGTLAGAGTWTTTLRVGSRPGSYPLLFVAQDAAGDLKAASALATVQVLSGTPALRVEGILVQPARDTVHRRSRNRSWRESVALRTMINPGWVREVAAGLVGDRSYEKAIAKAVAIDREKISMTGQWPKRESFRSYAKLESIMSKYWANGGITLAAATANQVGNVLVIWRRTPGLTITMNKSVARSLGTRASSIKVGNVQNGIGFAMILLDFWNNMSSAQTPVEAREAWYKAGYSSLDLYLADVVGNTFGAAAALPGMFTSYILMSSYDSLIGGYKQCWFKKMAEEAAAEDYLAEDTGDTLAVNKVLRAMESPRGLKGTLMDWWAGEAPNWGGWMGGCGNWDLAEARGYRKAFVDRLMRTNEVEIRGKRYHPWSFYYSVSRMLVRKREKKHALKAAAELRQLEGAYLTMLHDRVYRGTFRVVQADDPEVPIQHATISPVDWLHFAGWKSGEKGNFTAKVRGDDFSPLGTILVSVAAPQGQPRLFVLTRDVFQEVTR